MLSTMAKTAGTHRRLTVSPTSSLSVEGSRWAHVPPVGSPAARCSARVRTAFPDWDDSGRMAEPARDRGFVAAADRYLQVVG